ncbi:hypothetical protein, partial [Castellaniella caeni]
EFRSCLTSSCPSSNSLNVTIFMPDFNFRKVSTKKFGGQKLPASPDAIHLGKKQLYFVEFKNQFPSKIDNDAIRRKFKQGTKILQDMLVDFAPRDWQRLFCVAFKPNNRPTYFDSRHFEESKVRFNLDDLNAELGHFYDKVLTEDIDFYSRQFRQLKC